MQVMTMSGGLLRARQVLLGHVEDVQACSAWSTLLN